MFQNYLHFKNKKSLMAYDGTDVTPVGYDQEDGLPSDKWGEITAMTSTWKYLFAAVKGATYSHILAMDSAHAWHYYARIPTPSIWVRDMFLTDANDGIDRLWCIFGNYGYPGYFLNPMVNPVQAGTYSYVPTGHFSPPIFDGGMAEEKGAFYDMRITADAMGSNSITALYGLDGANPVSTLGKVATIIDTLVFGSPYGLEGYRIQPRFDLANLNVSGTSPAYREATIHYLKDPDKREIFDLNIDLEATGKSVIGGVEAVIGSLSYLMNKKTLSPFWYGRIGTRAVRVLDIPSEEETKREAIFGAEREGFVRLRVGEIL